jgi:hypothetical protein
MHCPAASLEVIPEKVSAILLIGVKAVGYLAMSIWSRQRQDLSQTGKGRLLSCSARGGARQRSLTCVRAAIT